MEILILAQKDLKAGLGHFNRSRLLYEYFKKKYPVKYYTFKKNLFNKKTYIYDKKNKRVEDFFSKRVKQKCLIISDEISFPKNLINKIKKNDICSISPKGNLNKFAKLIYTRTKIIGKKSISTNISSNINNFLPGSKLIKIKKKNYFKHLRKKKLSIGISMGGYDNNNYTLAILKLLFKLNNNLSLHILLNKRNYSQFKKIKNYIHKKKINAKLYDMKKNTWTIFKKCTLVLLSGGITSFESVFVGIPSINIINDPQKKMLTSYLEKKKITKIFKIHNKYKILNLINNYFINKKLLFEEKKKLDKFAAKIKLDPYKRLENLLLKKKLIYN